MGSVPGGQATGIQRVRNTRGTLRGFRLTAPRGPQEERDARQAAAITGRYSTTGRTQHLRRLQGRQQGRIRRRAPPTTITQRLRRNRLTALTRIAATPAYQRILRQRAFSRNQALHSALEAIEKELHIRADIDASRMEIITACIVPQWWELPHAEIANWKTEALTHHGIHCSAYPAVPKSTSTAQDHHGETGAAAVYLDPRTYREAYLGPDRHATVPAAELTGLVLPHPMATEDP